VGENDVFLQRVPVGINNRRYIPCLPLQIIRLTQK
jgi:hypothetical protein